MAAQWTSDPVYEFLENYPWDTDKEFQGGLSAILGPNSTPSQIRELTLRAQCYYLSRKRSMPIDFDGYKAYLDSQPTLSQNTTKNTSESSTLLAKSMSASRKDGTDELSSTPAESATSSLSQDAAVSDDTTPPKSAPYPPTFAEIVAMITSGAPIPGIKEIPDTILAGEASKAKIPKRRKPWEKDISEDQVQGRVGGVFGDDRDRIITQEYPDA